MEDITSSAKSSSVESVVEEDFNWITDKNFSSENKKDYLKYPLSLWRDLVYESDSNIYSIGECYEARVNKVLKNDVFKSFEFFESRKGEFKINLMKSYKVNAFELSKNSIVPDFFVHKIEIEKFNELLENRKYMMRTFQKINTTKKYISIIGETKVSHHSAFKNNNQRRDYIKFIQIANLQKEEELVLMYVYDESYKLFKEDSPINEDKIFLLLCYIPRLFLEDCYRAYNDIIKELKLNIKEIDLKKKPNKILFTKKELIQKLNVSEEKLNASEEKLNAKEKELEKRKKVEICMGSFGITIFILIIAFLIQKNN